MIKTEKKFNRIAITGGAGYIGSALVPYLLGLGYEVKVLDLFLYDYDDDIFDEIKDKSHLEKVKMDIRDEKKLTQKLADVDAVIHLACISNDPSFELNPSLGKSINYDAFFGLLRSIRSHQNIQRFIYASTSSVYGVKKEKNVTEDFSCEPLTDYSKYKFMCEEVLKKEELGGCDYVILRPATVCGYAPRLRLDLTVNILTTHALINKKIRVFGGSQLRPNININDIIKAYRLLLEAPSKAIHKKIFNAGFQNLPVLEIARLVQKKLGGAIQMEPTNDLRSYRINSDKIHRELGFQPQHTIEEAVQDLHTAYQKGLLEDPLNNPRYYNIKTMARANLT